MRATSPATTSGGKSNIGMRFLPLRMTSAYVLVAHFGLPFGEREVRGVHHRSLRAVTAAEEPVTLRALIRHVTSTSVSVGLAAALELGAGESRGGRAALPAGWSTRS
jgi:hypothetical protein